MTVYCKPLGKDWTEGYGVEALCVNCRKGHTAALTLPAGWSFQHAQITGLCEACQPVARSLEALGALVAAALATESDHSFGRRARIDPRAVAGLRRGILLPSRATVEALCKVLPIPDALRDALVQQSSQRAKLKARRKPS